MVEFKPALGWVLREYLKDYTHWAYGDLDVFFGDLTKGWLEPSEMRDYDVITYRLVTSNGLIRLLLRVVHEQVQRTIRLFVCRAGQRPQRTCASYQYGDKHLLRFGIILCVNRNFLQPIAACGSLRLLGYSRSLDSSKSIVTRTENDSSCGIPIHLVT